MIDLDEFSNKIIKEMQQNTLDVLLKAQEKGATLNDVIIAFREILEEM